MGDTSLAIKSKPFISQATPLRTGEGKSSLLREQPRADRTSVNPPSVIFLEAFILCPHYYLGLF